MTSGVFGSRSAWVPKVFTNGRRLWGPSNNRDGLLIGAQVVDDKAKDMYSPDFGIRYSSKMFYDTQTGAFRAGSITESNPTRMDAALRGAFSASFGLGCEASGLCSISSGLNSRASASYTSAFGSNSLASSTGAFAAGSSTAQGTFSAALGSANALGSYSFATSQGSSSGVNAFSSGAYSYATRYAQKSHGSGIFSSVGDAQHSKFVMYKQTTNATATEVQLGDTQGYVTIAPIRTMAFQIKIAAHRTDVSGTAAVWPLITGGITRDSTGNCRLLGTVVGAGTTTLCDAGGATWSVSVTADSSNNRLAVTVTGEAGKTIRWVCDVDIVEVG